MSKEPIVLDVVFVEHSRSVDPCYNYTVLDNPWRATNRQSYYSTCDTSFTWRGWYRLFLYGLNVRISDTCVIKYRCGTNIPLWIRGGHPRVEDGVVIRDVCGHWDNYCCYYGSYPIKVKACPGNYYVYELVSPTVCSSAYCADTCVAQYSCGTDITLWIRGGHPTVEDGVVTRDVCGHKDNYCCYYESFPVKVKACPGNYYVYELVSPNVCNSAYCAGNYIHMNTFYTFMMFVSLFIYHYSSKLSDVSSINTSSTAITSVTNSTDYISFNPCYNYTVLDNPWRVTSNSQSSSMCDTSVTWRGWYRLFINSLSAQIPETCVATYRCGTAAPLWLRGGHPTVDDGVVTRDVCSHWSSYCCYYQSFPIKVKACPGNYYVYELVSPTLCNSAYCAAVTNISSTYTTVTPEISSADVSSGTTTFTTFTSATISTGNFLPVTSTTSTSSTTTDHLPTVIYTTSNSPTTTVPLEPIGSTTSTSSTSTGHLSTVISTTSTSPTTTVPLQPITSTTSSSSTTVSLQLVTSTTSTSSASTGHLPTVIYTASTGPTTTAFLQTVASTTSTSSDSTAPLKPVTSTSSTSSATTVTLQPVTSTTSSSSSSTGHLLSVISTTSTSPTTTVSVTLQKVTSTTSISSTSTGHLPTVISITSTSPSTTVSSKPITSTSTSFTTTDLNITALEDCKTTGRCENLLDQIENTTVQVLPLTDVIQILDMVLNTSEKILDSPSADPNKLMLQANRVLKASEKLVSMLVKPTNTSDYVNFTVDTVEVEIFMVGRQVTLEKIPRLNTTHASVDIDLIGIAKNNTERSANVAFMSYNTMENLLKPDFFSTSNGMIKTMMSTVISATLPKTTNTTLTKPVIFTLKHIREFNPNGSLSCVYWNISEWIVDGCSVLETNSSYTVCSCDHLSTFALIMQTSRPPESDPLMELLNLVCVIVGLVFFSLALLTFALCQWSPGVNNVARINICISLLLAHLLFLLTQQFLSVIRPQQVLCAVISGLLHFLFLSGFVWMFIEAVLLFICVENLSQISSRNREVLSRQFLCVIGYLVALVVVAVSAVADPKGYGSEMCWIKIDKGFVSSFLGPVCMIITSNTILFIKIVISLNSTLKSRNTGVLQMKQTKIIVFKTLAQFVVLGCSWILGFFTNSSKELEILFLILNSQQGTFIFLIYCVLNNEVRQQYRKLFKCLCCGRKQH
ncbi:hypothetical protein QQF64_000469 [Cirrhinus molitorella]|uniref:Uncharacterized protein n=1 Tax=Cirrhinus molitorella TaxID=172907 RepID=A0ABR3NXD1_9TELE